MTFQEMLPERNCAAHGNEIARFLDLGVSEEHITQPLQCMKDQALAAIEKAKSDEIAVKKIGNTSEIEGCSSVHLVPEKASPAAFPVTVLLQVPIDAEQGIFAVDEINHLKRCIAIVFCHPKIDPGQIFVDDISIGEGDGFATCQNCVLIHPSPFDASCARPPEAQKQGGIVAARADHRPMKMNFLLRIMPVISGGSEGSLVFISSNAAGSRYSSASIRRTQSVVTVQLSSAH